MIPIMFAFLSQILQNRCVFRFYSNVASDFDLTTNSTQAGVSNKGIITVSGEVRNLYQIKTSITTNTTLFLFSKSQQASIQKIYIVIIDNDDCPSEGPSGWFNITLNSICPGNGRCTKQDDLNMLNERRSIAPPTNYNKYRTKMNRFQDELYCSQCSATDLSVVLNDDGSSTVLQFVPQCDPQLELCNPLLYPFQSQDEELNQFVSQWLTNSRFVSNRWTSQRNGWPATSGACSGAAEFVEIGKKILQTGLDTIGGVEEYYEKQALITQVIIGCSAAVGIIVVAIVVLLICKIKKRNTKVVKQNAAVVGLGYVKNHIQ